MGMEAVGVEAVGAEAVGATEVGAYHTTGICTTYDVTRAMIKNCCSSVRNSQCRSCLPDECKF